MKRRIGVGIVAAWLAVVGMQNASAYSLAHQNVNELPALVLVNDGKDRNDDVTLRYNVGGKNYKSANGKSGKHRKDGKHQTQYLFGYFDAGEFSALTGKKGKVSFADGSAVDFAIAEKGSDGIFGTGDDVYYRLSDAEDYADLYFRRPVGKGKWSASVFEDDYFGKLMIAWDTDLDGKTDLRVHLRTRGRYDGMAVTAVPLPAAGLLFASGLAGLAMLRRRRSRTRTAEVSERIGA